MPKLITTRTRTSELGKPEIISTYIGGFGKEGMKHKKIIVDYPHLPIFNAPLAQLRYYLSSNLQANKNLGS